MSAASTLDGGKQDGVTMPFRGDCGRCGARRVDRQIGLERTPDEFVATMVQVFREVWRVLRKDGTCWVNLGDSYAGSGRADQLDVVGALTPGRPGSSRADGIVTSASPRNRDGVGPVPGLKPKDLCMIPARVAIALQADGWYLRSDIIWHKPNPMPESVTDRPTKAHEYIYLLTKGVWSSRVVKLSDLKHERVHLGRYLRSPAPGSRACIFCVDLASAIFDATQRESDFSLPPFYAQEWKKRPEDNGGLAIGGLPAQHRAAGCAARFLDGESTAEDFLKELNGLWLALRNGHDLLESWVLPGGAAPYICRDGDGAVAVHYPGEICQFDLVHGALTISRPRSSVYWYDADAVREPGISPEMTREEYAAALKNTSEAWYPRVNVGERDNGAKQDNNLTAGRCPPGGRNARSVWTIPTQPYPGAHFATFPEALAERCILAGCPAGGRVLDPFVGSGTVVQVARRHGRIGIGLDLSWAYLHEHAMARGDGRTSEKAIAALPMFAELP